MLRYANLSPLPPCPLHRSSTLTVATVTGWGGVEGAGGRPGVAVCPGFTPWEVAAALRFYTGQ